MRERERAAVTGDLAEAVLCLCLVEGGYGAEVGLVGWNGAFVPRGLGIDSCLY
jgi:hypothetical protein